MSQQKYFIYALQYNPTQKLYIGSTVNLESRYQAHISSLQKGKHQSKELQADYNKHGEDFSVYILEEIEDGDKYVQVGYKKYIKHRIAEYRWMDIYNTLHDGYNIQDTTARKVIDGSDYIFPLKEGRPKLPNERTGG